MAGISAMYSMADFSLRQIIPFHRSRWLTVPDMSIPVPTHPLQMPSLSLHLTYPTLALLVLLSLYQSCQPLSVKQHVGHFHIDFPIPPVVLSLMLIDAWKVSAPLHTLKGFVAMLLVLLHGFHPISEQMRLKVFSRKSLLFL